MTLASCGPRSLCSDQACTECHARSFAGYTGQTAQGRLKRDCWVVERNEKTPREVFQQSNAKFSFRCDAEACGHVFESALSNIVGGAWCPFCSNPPKQLCADEGCKACFAKSLASWEAMTERGFKRDCWVVDWNKKTPRQVFRQSNAKFSFRCDVEACGHVFESALCDIVGGGTWCPFCSNKQLCVDEGCEACFAKSLASWEARTARGLKRDCWIVERNENTPRQVFQQSNAKWFFRCDAEACGHVFESTLKNIVGNDRWCPFCSNKQLCADEGCEACFAKSLASWEARTARGLKRDCWVVDWNKKTPRQVFRQSSAKFSFRCDVEACGHVFESTLNNIVGRGSWCPFCATSRGNAAVSRYLREQTIDLVQSKICVVEEEKCFPDCVSPKLRPLRFDATVSFMEGRRLLVEFDGIQHFEYVPHFHRSPEDMGRQRIHDAIKTKFALENGWVLLRIAYTDIERVEDLVRNGLEATKAQTAGRIIFSDSHLYAQQSHWARTCPALRLSWAQATIRRFLERLAQLKRAST